MNPREPGLFAKGEMSTSVYVDDSCLDAPTREEAVSEREKI